jgi:toluene monooxygenase electron transfer component
MATIATDDGSAFACDPDDTVLRAALRAGLGFPYECNVGSCGNCRFELVEGKVEHRRSDPPAWSERDRQRNRWLGCQARPLGDCRIKVRLDDRYVSAHTPVRRQLQLRASIPMTHDISEFRFLTGGAAPFLPGQYALLYLPGVSGGRPYSFCNVDGNTGNWSFQIKRVPGGEASSKLFDMTRIGDCVAADGPFGMAYLREDSPRDLLLVAGGSGLSPMISIARAAAASRKLQGKAIHFVYGGRTPEDICGEEILSALPGYGSRIRYLAAISEPEECWNGPTGFVHEVVRDAYGEALRSFEIYFAGPAAMGEAMQKMLFDESVPLEQVHFDQFF